MRFKTWRSRKDTHLHLLCAEGGEAFEALPVAIRNLGPWMAGRRARSTNVANVCGYFASQGADAEPGNFASELWEFYRRGKL